MAQVRRVYDRARDRVLAYKCSLGPEFDRVVAAEFDRLATLRHRALPRGWDRGRTRSGRAAFTLDLVPGAPLVAGAVDLRVLAADLLDVLAYLHCAGWAYLDLQPENVLVEEGAAARGPVLIDLGLARPHDERPPDLAGTPLFMAPELLRGEAVDGRADFYSLGLLVVWAATGALPFRAKSAAAVGREKLVDGAGVVERARAAVDGAWHEWLGRALAARREDRFLDAGEAMRALPESGLGRAGGGRGRRLALPFVGHEAALGRVAAAVAGAAESGVGEMLTVVGEPGLGGRRFLAEAGLRAQRAGHRVAWLDGPDSELLAGLEAACEPFECTEGPAEAVAPGMGSSASVPSESQRIDVVLEKLSAGRTAEAASGVAEPGAGESAATGWLLIRPSGERRSLPNWLRAQGSGDLPVVVLNGRGPDREGEPGDAAPGTSGLAESASADGGLVCLEPLAQKEVEQLLRLTRGGDVADRHGVRLWRESGGQVAYLAAMLTGALGEPFEFDDGRERAGAEGGGRIPTASLLDGMARRLEGLDEGAQGVLEVLALARTPLDASSLASAAGIQGRSGDGDGKCNVPAVELVLAGLRRRAVLAPVPTTGPQGYQLALPALGVRIAETMAGEERAETHGRLARALSLGGGWGAHERAYHAEAGGLRELAHAESLEAARSPELAPVPRVRSEAYRRALRTCGASADRAEIARELMEALLHAGFLSAAAELVESESPPTEPLSRTRWERLRAEVRFRQGEPEQAIEALGCAASWLGDEPEAGSERAGVADEERVLIGLRRARVLESRGDLAEALAAAEGAMAMAESGQAVSRQALNVRGSLRVATGDSEGGRRDLVRGLEESRAAGDLGEEASARNNLGILALKGRDWARAVEHFAAGLELRESLGDPGKAATACDNLGVARHRHGDSGGAAAAFERSLRFRRQVGDAKRLADSHNNLGALYYTQRQLDPAQRHLSTAIALRRRIEVPVELAKTLNNLALVEAARGDLEAAVSGLDESIALHGRLDNTVAAARSRVNLAGVVTRLGRPRASLRLLDTAGRVAEAEPEGGALLLAVREYRASAQLVLGHVAEAEASARGALAAAPPGAGAGAQARLLLVDAALIMDSWGRGTPASVTSESDEGGDVESPLERAQRLVCALSREVDDDAPPMLRCAVERRLAQVALAGGEQERAIEHLGRALTALHRNSGEVEEGVCHRVRAELCVVQGRLTEAAEAVEVALECHERWGARFELAQACGVAARVAERRGEVEYEASYLEVAQEVYRELGNKMEEKRITDRLESLRRPKSEAEVGGDRADALEILRRIGSMLTRLGEPGELLRNTLSVVLETIGAERGQVFLLDPQTGALEIQVSRNMDATTSEDAEQYSRTILERTRESQSILFSEDAQQDEAFRHFKSVVEYRIASFICAPLMSRGRVLGTIYVDNRSVVNSFDRSDADFIQVFASLAGVALENALLTEELVAENESLRREVRQEWDLPNVVGRSSAMRRVVEVVRRVADTRSTVLLQGETGTGKEVIARALHYASPRAEKRFVAVDCGALSETLIESELFGHRRGAFSGATSDKSGLFEEAHGGTIFLDEITNLDVGLQAKLLRVIQEGEVRRLGDTRSRKIDVRIVCATNLDLREEVKDGRFREDLFFRINIVAIPLPPLRERPEDIPLLAHFFLERMEARVGRTVKSLSAEVRDAFADYDWPGNIRELENTIEGMVVMCLGDRLNAEDIPSHLRETSGRPRALSLDSSERRSLEQALEGENWIQTRAAVKLGISERVLRYKMKKHGIRNPRRARES